MPSRFLKLSYHFAVYAVGVSVLLAAVGVTIVRLLLPDIGSYRGEVEAWVSRYMGFPVAIHSLQASWEGWIPNLYLSNIDLLNKEGTAAITHFDSARISIDPVATLLQRHFVPQHLVITGFQISATRQADGSLYIQGYRLKERQAQTQNRNELAEWLFSQNRVEIQQASIEWRDIEHRQVPVLLQKVHLLLRTDRNRIQMEGSAQLPPAYGKEMDFAFDARGNLLTSNWSGELYIQGNNINPDKWYREYRPLDLNIAGGNADIRVWSTWTKARLSNVQGRLEYHDFAALIGRNQLHINNLTYQFLGEKRNDDNWRFSIKLDDLETENGSWPQSRFNVTAEPTSVDKTYTYTARFSYLKLGDLMPLLSSASFIPDKAKKVLDELRLHGNLIDGKLIYDPGREPGQRFLYDVRFDKLSSIREKDLPRIENLSGHTWGSLENGTVEFTGDSADIKAPGFRIDNISINELDGSMTWSKNASGIRLRTPLLTLSNPDVTLRVAGNVRIDKGKSPYIDAMAEVAHANLETLTGYIPWTSKFKMREWMEKAVLGGSLDSAITLIRGDLSDFPFRNAKGQFKLIANVSNGVLEYSPQWPVVDNINAEVVIDEMKLSSAFNSGHIYNAKFKEGTVSIPDLFQKEKHIYVKGRVDGGTADLKHFLENSPLSNNITLAELDKALTGGEFALDLDLSIPFKIPDKKPVIGGNITLYDTGLASTVTDMKLDGISGNIAFSGDSVSGSDLAARFNGKPVKVDVAGVKGAEPGSSSTVITLHGNADNAFIADEIDHYLPHFPLGRQAILDRLSGSTRWDASLKFDKPAEGNRLQRIMTVSSELEGLSVDLPAPLRKEPGRKVPFEITRSLGGDAASTMKIDYGDNISGAFTFSPRDKKELRKANIQLGDSNGHTTDNGVMISGRIKQLPVNEWWDFLSTLKKDKAAPALTGINADLEIGSLSLLNQQFSDVNLMFGKKPGGWQIDVHAADLAGTMILPESPATGGLVTIDMDRLALQKVGGQKRERPDPAAFPSVQAHVGEFSYAGRNLGAMTLESSPAPDGMKVDTLTFDKPGLSIRGEGLWTMRDGDHKSSFNIETHAEKIDTMLKTFGYDVTAIKNGETDLLIDADWAGSPMDFALENLNGHISMHLGEGQLLKVDPSAGRLFGLLSIQALPRRLTLDFRDLFGKGLAFDSIEGNFDITNGEAYTNDLFMKGASAEIAVSGRTGLSEKDYDQVVTVTPQVSGSLPVAGALFGPVGVGVGTVFYLASEMFHSLRRNIDSLLRYQYTITGSWDDPVIRKINPAEDDKG